METMNEIKTLRTYNLDDLFDFNKIISIVKVYSAFGHSLIIALKAGGEWRYHNMPQFMHYGKPDPYVVTISLSRFTYSVPCYMAIPREYWKHIKVLEKAPVHNLNDKFYKATITKKVIF